MGIKKKELYTTPFFSIMLNGVVDS